MYIPSVYVYEYLVYNIYIYIYTYTTWNTDPKLKNRQAAMSCALYTDLTVTLPRKLQALQENLPEKVQSLAGWHPQVQKMISDNMQYIIVCIGYITT